jgi:hypothetical protein
MKESDVILTQMPQADSNAKHRPAVILREMPPFGDMLVCGVSTNCTILFKGLTSSSPLRMPSLRQAVSSQPRSFG